MSAAGVYTSRAGSVLMERAGRRGIGVCGVGGHGGVVIGNELYWLPCVS